MDTEDLLQKTLETILKKLGVEYKKIEVTEEEKDTYSINIKSDNPSMLIGYHGENIQALQHLLKVLSWKKSKSENQFNVVLDVDDYRKRQEENVLSLADRKIEMVRRSNRPQMLPPMSAYFRRKIHLHCMGAGYEDIETASKGEAERRHIVISLKK
jgi:spoIIIJ-associated protein